MLTYFIEFLQTSGIWQEFVEQCRLAVRGADELPADVNRRSKRAIPASAPAKPLKPRRLLVMDEHMGHPPIPHANYALGLLGRRTGAFETVFSNDLDNLKFEKIRQFEAVMLNSSEADISAHPAVREGLLRFVREGRRPRRDSRSQLERRLLARVHGDARRAARAPQSAAGGGENRRPRQPLD
jgi:hypothetical protein